ncbi:MAG: ROK family protein [Helcococcus sp.]|nr:ROK family protein [Helcococcus sp.]
MYLIFDIGGSATKVAIINEYEKIIEKASIKAKSNLKDFLISLEKTTQIAIEKFDIKGIGISSPGTVDEVTGNVGGISALEYIHTYNFAYHLQEKFNLPVAIENDANCSALCEMYFSKLENKNIVFIVIGSGIGGAIINNGVLQKGRKLESGEFGYMLLRNNEGEYTNFSQLATLPNVRRRIIEKYGIEKTTYEIFDLYFKNESPYYKEVNEMFQYLCMGIYNISYAIDPDEIYIGGGISQSEKFINELLLKMDEGIFKDAKAIIKPVTYYNDNNLLGAYVNLIIKLKEGKKLCIQ